jgi:(4-alkanoyl-5-oxo-2,5-dihydrofuran-3-yl)methyl phosphate reductase
MTHLITGATGNVGSLVVERLINLGESPRIFVRNKEKAQQRFGDRVDIFVGDLADVTSLKPALLGADTVLLVTSGPELAQQDETLSKAARSVGVKHLVKLSSYDANEQNIGTGVWHARGEAAIRESGIPFTFVQPSGFMSNALYWARSIKAEGIVRTATGDGKIPFIHPQDIADVTVEALMSEAYVEKSLPITGPQALSYAEMAAKIGATIGRKIRSEVISEEDARQQQVAWGAPAPLVNARLSIFRAIREGRLGTVTGTVKKVLGREPIAFDQWVIENAQAFS